MPLFGSSSRTTEQHFATDNRIAADAGAFVARAETGSVLNIDQMGDEAFKLGVEAFDFGKHGIQQTLDFANSSASRTAGIQRDLMDLQREVNDDALGFVRNASADFVALSSGAIDKGLNFANTASLRASEAQADALSRTLNFANTSSLRAGEAQTEALSRALNFANTSSLRATELQQDALDAATLSQRAAAGSIADALSTVQGAAADDGKEVITLAIYAAAAVTVAYVIFR